MKSPTLGERRVRVSFVPASGSQSLVSQFKGECAGLIDTLESLRATALANGDAETARHYSLAMTDIESAAMWAVKGMTANL